MEDEVEAIAFYDTTVALALQRFIKTDFYVSKQQ